MTSTTFVPSISVYTAANSKSYYQLSILADKFSATATWLRQKGAKFKSFVQNGIAQFTFFFIPDALLARLQAYNAQRAAEIEAADEAKANGFDTTAAPINTVNLAASIQASVAAIEEAKTSGRVHTSAGGGEVESPVVEVSAAPEFVAASAELLDRCFTLKALKSIARDNGLKVSGTKAQLVERLVSRISVEYCWMVGDRKAK